MNHTQLTGQQKLADYEYMWKVLNSSFPVRGIMRRLGYDWNEIYARHKERVVNTLDDLGFCRAMAGVFEDFKDRGTDRFFAHIRLFEPARFRDYQKTYKAFSMGAWEKFNPAEFQPWLDAVNQEVSECFYSRFDDTAADGKFYWKGQAPEKLVEGASPVFGDNEKDVNVLCSMLSDDVALIEVKTLNMLRLAGDREIVFDFYCRHKGCKHLILDFRKNGGGATDYWQKLLVAPTIGKEMHNANYITLTVSEENREFIRCGYNECKELGDEEGKVKPISRLPHLPNFEKDDLDQLTHFLERGYTIEPDAEHHFGCEKVWLLVSNKVYSSSEAFAVFCKTTGYATVVGERTGGDGIGIAPFHAVLPQSGLVIRYSGENGLNADGSSNAEHCTVPDILCDPDEALEVCLREIK